MDIFLKTHINQLICNHLIWNLFVPIWLEIELSSNVFSYATFPHIFFTWSSREISSIISTVKSRTSLLLESSSYSKIVTKCSLLQDLRWHPTSWENHSEDFRHLQQKWVARLYFYFLVFYYIRGGFFYNFNFFFRRRLPFKLKL